MNSSVLSVLAVKDFCDLDTYIHVLRVLARCKNHATPIC